MLSKFLNNKHFNFFIFIWIFVLSIILINKKQKESFGVSEYNEYLENIKKLTTFLKDVKDGNTINGNINLTGKLKINGQDFDTILSSFET